MNNEPVAYGRYIENAKMWLVVELDADMPEGYIPLYTHPHPDNLGLAESIIKQQKLEINALHNLVKEQDKKIIDLAFEKVYAERSAEVVAELYTHPVKEDEGKVCARCGAIAYDPVIPQIAKEQLTDEEIIKVYEDMLGVASAKGSAIDFARAILRKAQE